ncbi:MAG: PhnD/SsuA/transferrin family substrate-binding protein [Pseudomonadota bacterium]
MIAALPMYDWPEIRAETAAYWAILRDGFRGAGIAAPDHLIDAPADPWPHWRDPALVLSQTCGLPYAARLVSDVSLIGAPAYDLQGLAPGTYCSEIVVRKSEGAAELKTLRGRKFAFNMRESQSGFAAPAALLGDPAAFFGEMVATGSHRASILAVAEGRADVAAIDAVTWQLALRHEPAARLLGVVARTAPTPGLPYITASRPEDDLSLMRLIIQTAIVTLPADIRAALLLRDLVRKHPSDYAPLAAGWPPG